jgi:hypothetical protein
MHTIATAPAHGHSNFVRCPIFIVRDIARGHGGEVTLDCAVSVRCVVRRAPAATGE